MIRARDLAPPGSYLLNRGDVSGILEVELELQHRLTKPK